MAGAKRTGIVVHMGKRRISKTEFKPKAFEILRKVKEEQAPYVVTDRGAPVVEIRPVHARKLDALRKLNGMVLKYDDPLKVLDDPWDAEQ